MAQESVVEGSYLAVVSEWSTYNARGGLLGNAYPIYSYDSDAVVQQPEDVFYNPGYVFLLARDTLAAWDFIRVRPVRNEKYQDRDRRECGYICHGLPDLINKADEQGNVATLLDVADFDPGDVGSQLQSPAQNVTPLFFVRDRSGAVFGPMIRQRVLRSGHESLEAINWVCPGDTGLLGEFTMASLKVQNVRLCEYVHTDASLNEVVACPIHLLIGPVHALTPDRMHDRLSGEQLTAWFARSSAITDLRTREVLAELQGPVSAVAGVTEEQIRQRLARVRKLLPNAEFLAEERRRIATEFMATEEGKRALDARITQEIQKRSEELQAAVRHREKEVAAKEAELDEKLRQKQDELNRKLATLHDEIDTQARRKRELDATLVALRDDLSRSSQLLADKVREELPLIAVLTSGLRPAVEPSAGGRPEPDDRDETVWTNVPEIIPSRTLLDTVEESELLENLLTALHASGLSIGREFLTNLYISMKAAPLNLVAGPPGHGKSSLLSGLASALGHADALLDIAVRRSWSDDRYLLGFYDAFHGRFDPGPTGLASRLLQAERDWDSGGSGIYFVVLDEFNLAAPEYYFSQLMQVIPRDGDRRIRLYDPARDGDRGRVCELRLHPNLRFWGTINYDETTERLSPRMLDRTGMIFLTPRDVVPSHGSPESDPGSFTPGISARRVFEDFYRPPEQCSEDCWEKIEPVLALIRSHSDEWGTGIPISPRCLRAMQSYLANSVGLLDPVRAVDFVIQQRLLPSLRGRGERFTARVRALGEMTAQCSFERSARHIQEALALAESGFGDIDFFVY